MFGKLNTNKIQQFNQLEYIFKWFVMAVIIGGLTGSAAAFFLKSLEWATVYREVNRWVIIGLPIGGLFVGMLYHYFGSDVVKGNNQLIEEFHSPKQIIPLKMAPLVVFGTIVTHLFGGSAGREGTAVQMGGAIADQFTRLFRLNKIDRKIILTMGISAGFAAVFGTPLAGAVFALEVLVVGRMRYEAIFPSFLTAILANYVCSSWNLTLHTHYHINYVPTITPINLAWCMLAGIIFGLTAMLFSSVTHFFSKFFKQKINYPPLRPFLGGVIIVLVVFVFGGTKYLGLGIPIIEKAFVDNLNLYDFLLKLLFTAFTLGAGFKGGEVTPLFFIGAALGNALVWFIPLPMALLAGMGFVAVFSGATNTPIACTLMGIELFGVESALYIAIACITGYLFSGHTGVYGEQIIGSPKNVKAIQLKGEKIGNHKHYKND